MTPKNGKHLPAVVLLVIAALLLIAWSLAVPIYEAPDEPHHWRYAHYLHQHHTLPLYTPQMAEANSPPLYYSLIAPFADSDAGPGLIPGKQRCSAQPPACFDSSARDLSLYRPIRWGRLVSVGLSVLTVLFAYLTGLAATNRVSTGLLCGGLLALMPQFTFRGMNVANDVLATTLPAACTYIIVLIIRRGYSNRRAITATVTAALAFLSKINAIFLPLPLGLAFISGAGAFQVKARRLSVLMLAPLIAAPWLIRNQILYGDPLASGAMLKVVHNIVDLKTLSSPYFFTVFPLKTFQSFVGLFGWLNLPMPGGFYIFYFILFSVATLGCVWRMRSRPEDRFLILTLFTFPLMSVALAVYINLSFSQPQGRFLFPSLGAMALMGAMGLEALPGWSMRFTQGLLGILFCMNLYCLLFVIIPAYWH